MQRQGKTQGLPVSLHINWWEAQLCLNKDLLAEALISCNKSYWSTTLDVQCVQKVTAKSFRQNIPGLSALWGNHSTYHKQTCSTISSSYLQTVCSILFWSDYSYISMHRPSHMAGRGTASHIVGKKPGARKQLEICSLLWSLLQLLHTFLLSQLQNKTTLLN